jgi:hypothetical protein
MNYGALDLGLYTVCDFIPETRYYCTLNLQSTEMADAIDHYLYSGATDYVVSTLSNLDEKFVLYELVDSGNSVLNEEYGTLYLYRLKDFSQTN